LQQRNTMKKVVLAAFFAVSVVAVCIAADSAGEFGALVHKEGADALEVVREPTLYRVAELDGLPCSADEFGFLLDRPRISMVLARALDPGLDEYEIQSRPDGGWHVDDHGRLVGDMDLVEAAPGKRVYYITGSWRFIFGITFRGRMVLVPEFEEHAVDGNVRVDSRARGYMKIDNALAGFMARVVAYVFPGKVDARIKRFSDAVRKVAVAVHDDPSGMYTRLIASGKVPPKEEGEYRVRFLAVKDGGGS
jgi:hypothetical protein